MCPCVRRKNKLVKIKNKLIVSEIVKYLNKLILLKKKMEKEDIIRNLKASFIHPFLNSSKNSKKKVFGASKKKPPVGVKARKMSHTKSKYLNYGKKFLIALDPVTNIIITCSTYGDCEAWKNDRKLISVKQPYYGISQ